MYLEIDEGFPGHRKTLRLCAALKNPEAAWYVIRLWTWACRSCPTGDLTGMDPYDIEIAVQYRPLDGSCYAALVAAGFVDETNGSPVEIHNWMDRTGGAIAKMADAAARKKEYRAHKEGRCLEWCRFCDEAASVDSPEDIPRTGNGTAAGHSDPDKSSPVQSSPDPETPPARDPGAPVQRPEPDLWPAGTWLRKFGVMWTNRHQVTHGGGERTARACGQFSDTLAALPEAERIEAQNRAPEMLLAFFEDVSASRAKHPFPWFVDRFDALRSRAVAPMPIARGSPGRGHPSTATRDAAAQYLAKHGELP